MKRFSMSLRYGLYLVVANLTFGFGLVEAQTESRTTPTEELRCARNLAEAGGRWRTWTAKDLGPFEAALVATRGFDSPLSKLCIELVRKDGTRRGYPLDIFSAEDKAVVKQWIAQKAATSVSATAPAAGEYKIKKTDYDNEPGSFLSKETTHFRFLWGKKINDGGKAWRSEAFREMNFAYFERIWDFYERTMKAPMPYSKEAKKYKINIFVTGTGLKHNEEGFAFGAESIVIHPGGMAEGSSVIPHEFGHVVQFYSGGYRDSEFVGWFWECHANWHCHQFIPSYPPVIEGYSDRAMYDLSSSRMNYGSWPFLQYMAEHPKLSTAFCYEEWTSNLRGKKGQSLESPFQTFMRLAEEKKLAADGVAWFGDMIGEMAAHNATWDYVYQWFYRRETGHGEERMRQRALLSPVPDRPGWYRPLYAMAPRQYGYNIIDLVRDPGAPEVTVDLHGIEETGAASDWRATIVAEDASGNARYSRMWHTGKGTMALRPEDTQLYLVVAACPTKYTPLKMHMGYNGKARYSYEVALTGCKPAEQPPRSFRRQAGAAHPNGGGWVAKSAKVAATAYVAPGAQVRDRAQVTGNARIEDFAVIAGDAKVSGNAVVSGFALVRHGARVTDNARVRDFAVISDRVKLHGDCRVAEYVHVNGDGNVGGLAVLRGCGDVNTSRQTDIGGSTIAGNDVEMHTRDWKKPIEHGLFYDLVTNDQIARAKDRHDLQARWDFDRDTGEALKDVFADNDGVLRGKPGFVSDGSRKALALDGRGQYALLDGAVLDTPECTIDMTIRGTGAGQPHVIDFGSAEGSLFFTPGGDSGKAAFQISRGDKVEQIIAASALPANAWTRITIVLKAGEGVLYFDGKQVGRNAAMTLRPTDLNPRFGYLGRSSKGEGFFAGQIDDLAIYRKAFDSVAAIPATK